MIQKPIRDFAQPNDDVLGGPFPKNCSFWEKGAKRLDESLKSRNDFRAHQVTELEKIHKQLCELTKLTACTCN